MSDKAMDRTEESLDQALKGHLWGYDDTEFRLNERGNVELTGARYQLSGYEMPLFKPFIEDILGHTIDWTERKPMNATPRIPTPISNPSFEKGLAELLEEHQFSDEPRARLVHSHGQTSSHELYLVLYEDLDRVADLVVWPESTEDVLRLINLAVQWDVCLVPYGGGTNVSNALLLPANEKRKIVSVDMRRMNKVLSIDRKNLSAQVQAGITGSGLEEALQSQGLVVGHEPDSMELSTLGGWISTNASGMKKNRYGNIEDIVEKITLITPKGEVSHLDTGPRRSAGIQPRDLTFGSEGNLGIITEATLNIHPIPEETRFGSYIFPDFELGVDFLLALRRSGMVPASVRLVDNLQFRFSQALKPLPQGVKAVEQKAQRFFLEAVLKYDLRQVSAATVVMEGSQQEVSAQHKHLNRMARKFRGIAGGARNGQRGYMLTYAIAYIRDFLAPYYISGETYETSCSWDNIHDVVNAVSKRAWELQEQFNLFGSPFISARVTQLYHSGVCVYFTHGYSNRGLDEPLPVFITIEDEIRKAILAAGGSISHHHGVGKLRQQFMDEVITEPSRDMLRSLKSSVDPENIFGIRNGVYTD